MKCVLIKMGRGLRGATAVDHEVYEKFKRRLETMKPGTWLRMEWSRPRNGPQHRKMFALLQLVSENSETYNTPEKALVAVKLAAGFFDPFVDPKTGEIIQIPQSISYDAMEQDRFEHFYSQAIDAVLQHILPTMDRGTADRLLDMVIEGWA